MESNTIETPIEFVKVSKVQLEALKNQIKKEREHRLDLEKAYFMMLDLVNKFGVGSDGNKPSMMAIANAVFKSKDTVAPFMETINEVNTKYYKQDGN